MIHADYALNRSRFPLPELEPYQGQWVAFSTDGRRLLASADTLERLEGCLAAAGEDPEHVVYEQIPGPEDDLCLGGAELV